MSFSHPQPPPFPLGGYLANVSTDTSNPTGLQYEGREYWFEDVQASTTGTMRTLRSNRLKRVRCVRNCSGTILLPKRLVVLPNSGLLGDANANSTTETGTSSSKKYRVTAGPYAFARVNGYARIAGCDAYPVDDLVPNSGVPEGALFYIVVRGPTLIANQRNGTFAAITEGGWVYQATTGTTAAATDYADTDAGRLAGGTLALTAWNSTDVTAYISDAGIGWALSTLTASQTSTDILVDVMKRWSS